MSFDFRTMNKKYHIRHAGDELASMFPTWCEPQICDEDHLTRSRIMLAWEFGKISHGDLFFAIKEMRPAWKTEHRQMILRGPKVVSINSSDKQRNKQ